MKGSLGDLLAPLRCAGCRRPADGDLCGGCAERLQPLLPPLCARCGAPGGGEGEDCWRCQGVDGFTRARSLVRYGGPAAALAVALKRRGRPALAAQMGSLLALLAIRDGFSEATAVTFVPGGRGARRLGFDHAEMMAAAVASRLGLPCRRLLRRLTNGPRQADTALEDRWANVSSRFSARRASGRLILVDDIFTTGATAHFCGSALQQAGAERVDVLTWARALHRAS